MVLEVVRAGLVGHTASLALVELEAELGVGLLGKVLGTTDRTVREGVLALALATPPPRQAQSVSWGPGSETHLVAAAQPRQRDNPNTKNCQVNIPCLDLLIYFASSDFLVLSSLCEMSEIR